jgi:crotonobetainyl-CoA:carnitine CoA-transferase CaiB-like acyl-CoA transferase
MTMALGGLKVLDFTRHMAGPMATVALSDFGADVIKIEALPAGDGSRTTGTVFYQGESGLFLVWNRGKRSVAMDLRAPEAREIIDRLVLQADILIENFRPGVADAMGIGYERLSAVNPRLVHVSVSAFGEGPLGALPGTDPVVQAMSGVMSVTGEVGGEPLLVGVPIADFTGALMAVQGTLLALLARERTGRGQKVDVSMLHGLISALTTRLASYWGTGADPRANGSAHSVVAPYQAFRTSDGFIMAGVWDNGWERFCTAVTRPDLAQDPRFADNVSRVANLAQLNTLLAPIFRSKTTSEWVAMLRSLDVLNAPVNTFSEILGSEHVMSGDILGTVQHPLLGEVPQVMPATRLSETPGRLELPPPMLGQHTREVLSEAGLSEARIDELVQRNVVRQWQTASDDVEVTA